MATSERDVTALLAAVEQGDEAARAQLFAVLYDELRARATQLARGLGRGESLRATAVVHETYLRLARGGDKNWRDRAHFLATASKAMRHVMIDQVRARNRRRLDADTPNIELDDIVSMYEERAVDLEALEAALNELGQASPEMAQAVELRFFGGASVDETARMLGMSKRTFERRWESARAFLRSRVK